MMNNHGISLREMLIFLCILLFCLLLAIFYGEYLANNSFDMKENNNYVEKQEEKHNDNKKQYYLNYEDKMIDAAKRYIEFNKYESFSNDVIITLNSLISSGFIEKLYDNGEVCSGYVVIKENNGNIDIEKYLECPNYVTNR